MRRAVFVLVALAACKREPAPTSAAPDAAIAPEPKASAAVASASASLASASGSETPPRAETANVKDLEPPGEGDPDYPLAKTGKLAIWAQPEDASSLLLAKRATGPTKLLRKTSGKVRTIEALAVGDDVVVAWASELASGGTQLVALVTASADLAKVTAPTTIAMLAAPIQEQAHVALAKNPKGGVIVAHQGPVVRCTFLDQPSECTSFEVKAVSASGIVTKLASEKLDGGPSPEYRMLDIDGRALAVLGSSMRGGRTIAGVVVPYDPSEPRSKLTVPVCGGQAAYLPELARGAAGELVSTCIDSRLDDPTCIRPRRGDAERCLRVAAVASDGTNVAPSVKGRSAAVRTIECADGGAARLVLDGGRSIELVSKTDAVRDFAPTCAR